MNRTIDWIVRLAFVALVALVFHFAAEARQQRRRAEVAERRLEIVARYWGALRTRAILDGLDRITNEMDARGDRSQMERWR